MEFLNKISNPGTLDLGWGNLKIYFLPEQFLLTLSADVTVKQVVAQYPGKGLTWVPLSQYKIR
jgi:hypothetical protein